MAPFQLKGPFGLSGEKEIRFQFHGVYYIATERIAVDVDLNKSTQNECFINDVMGYDRIHNSVCLFTIFRMLIAGGTTFSLASLCSLKIVSLSAGGNT